MNFGCPHASLVPAGVGSTLEGVPLSTKVNVNLGISGDLADEALEWEKVDVALELGADIRWRYKVVGVQNEADHARLRVDTPDGTFDIEADWLIAADGARSTSELVRGSASTETLPVSPAAPAPPPSAASRCRCARSAAPPP